MSEEEEECEPDSPESETLRASLDLTSEILAKLPEMPGIPEWYE